MNLTRTSLSLAFAAGLVMACSPSGDVATDGATNPLLAHVPANTPYVFANIEPTSPAVTDAYLARMAPLFEALQSALDDIEVEVKLNPDADEEALGWFLAVYEELSGNMNRAGFEAMGLSLESHQAVYGNGLFPVVRLGLKDAQAFRATVERIESRAGVSAEEHQFNGQGYWRLGDAQAAAFIAILDDHVAFGAWPGPSAETDFLPEFLGQSLPAESLAFTGALTALNRERDYTPNGSGYVDLQRVADELLNADSRTAVQMQTLAEYDADRLGPVCEAEIRELVSQMPRITVGVTELTANAMAWSLQMDLDQPLAADLSDLVADVPVALANPTHALSLSLGINVGRLRSLALEKVNAMAADPFECSHLAQMNESVQQAAMQLNQPMPPFIGNLKGFRVVLNDFDPQNLQPEAARGLLSLEIEKPQMLTGMASMLVPGMENLDLQPGGDPVDVPTELMTMATPDLDLQAMMTGDAIGVALGREQFEYLVPFMENDDDNGDVFFSLDYDMAAFMDLDAQAAGHDDTQDPRVAAHRDAILAAYRNTLGRSRMEMSFTAGGLVIESRMTFR